MYENLVATFVFVCFFFFESIGMEDDSNILVNRVDIFLLTTFCLNSYLMLTSYNEISLWFFEVHAVIPFPKLSRPNVLKN